MSLLLTLNKLNKIEQVPVMWIREVILVSLLLDLDIFL